METTIKFNPELGKIAMSAFIIEKIHRCEDCPIRQTGDQATQVDLRPHPHVAQDLVAGLEGPSSQENLPLRRQGRHAGLNPTRSIRTNDTYPIKS